MEQIAKYFGFGVFVVQWATFGICSLLYPLNWSEPLSQFGYYSESKLVFGLGMTIGSIICFLFAKHLDTYWKHTSTSFALAGLCLGIVGWVPYEPYVTNFLFDTHNIAITLAIMFYSLPMLFISFKKSHPVAARASQVLFFAASVCATASVVARSSGQNVLYLQILTILVIQAWLIASNYLLLQHYHLKKLDHSRSL